MRAFLKSPLFVAIAVAVFCVVTQASQAFDHAYWNVWSKNSPKPVPEAAIIVSLDDGTPITSGSLAGSTADQARLVSLLAVSGASRVYFDLPLVSGIDQPGDRALFEAIRDFGPQVTLVNRARVDPAANVSHPITSRFPIPADVPLVASAWNVNFLGYATSSHSVIESGRKLVPALAAAEAGNLESDQHVHPDLGFRPEDVPVISGRKLLAGGGTNVDLARKTVYVTTTNPELDTALGYFGHGRVPAAIVDIAGSAGAARGAAINLGSQFLLALFCVIVLGGHRARARGSKAVIYAALVLGLIALPGILRNYEIITDVGPALIAALVYAPIRSSQKWRNRVKQTSVASGLPNIEALAQDGIARSQDVVAASISQYEQMLASLPRELHGECARHIARRLSLGAGDRQIYDNDNGHFVWLEDSRTIDALVEHLEGLKALFSSPLVIGGHVLDTNVHFGLDRNIDSSPVSRIQSALASANEADNKGKLYEEFGQQRLAESPWELSLHARIDEGLRNGDIWLALQPQYDLRTNRISGAEALIRWTDPERGAIPPDAFILQAERAGRIEALTYWVLEKAIAMGQELGRVAGPFQISVNLSARLVDHPALVQRVGDIVRATGADCSQITFEVTETFSMANREHAKRNLAALRAMGFRLSIDDFGTGQASLAYLSEIPSDEIKLDRRFVKAITSDARDRHIVESVIHLGHALGQEIVAEGIEDIATLEALRLLGCDLAQGYYVSKPMTYPELLEMLDGSHVDRGDARAMNV